MAIPPLSSLDRGGFIVLAQEGDPTLMNEMSKWGRNAPSSFLLSKALHFWVVTSPLFKSL
jgi:hypothetical protein